MKDTISESYCIIYYDMNPTYQKPANLTTTWTKHTNHTATMQEAVYLVANNCCWTLKCARLKLLATTKHTLRL